MSVSTCYIKPYTYNNNLFSYQYVVLCILCYFAEIFSNVQSTGHPFKPLATNYYI